MPQHERRTALPRTGTNPMAPAATHIPIGDYVIRSLSTDDVPAITRHANNRNVWVNLRDLFPFPYQPCPCSGLDP